MQRGYPRNLFFFYSKDWFFTFTGQPYFQGKVQLAFLKYVTWFKAFQTTGLVQMSWVLQIHTVYVCIGKSNRAWARARKTGK